jgi:adenylate cyclase
LKPVRAMNAAADVVTFVFTDMEGSARLIERMGDREAHELFKIHDDIIRRQLASFGAREVEQHGDGFLLAFENAWPAVSCAVAVQRDLAAHARACPRDRVRVRIGVHTGPVFRAGHGFFGKSVVIASRIAAMAKGGEILGSEPVFKAARGVARIVSGEPRAVELKGLSGTYVLYPIDWA